MNKIGTLNIVGVEYSLLYHSDFKELQDISKERDDRYRLEGEEPPKREALDGYCDYSSKEIHVFCDTFTAKDYFYMTLRHEITHAFLYEIGNTNHNNEEFVDKISKWTPQISNIFNEGMEKFYEFSGRRPKNKHSKSSS